MNAAVALVPALVHDDFEFLLQPCDDAPSMAEPETGFEPSEPVELHAALFAQVDAELQQLDDELLPSKGLEKSQRSLVEAIGVVRAAQSASSTPRVTKALAAAYFALRRRASQSVSFFGKSYVYEFGYTSM